MCGIAGFVGNNPPDAGHVESCLRLMGRRGPDANGVYRHCREDGRAVCLLHSRLSIIDLDPRSNQPMQRGDKVIVYNGEIYNYLELRQRAASYIPLSTASDTEVLLALLSNEGPGALDACEGMWAFAFYDESSGALALSRDRFGEKPLYCWEGDNGTYFASEIKFLAALSGRRFAINEEQVLRYLVLGYRALHGHGETFFRDVRELPSGCWMHLLPGRPPELNRYWTPRCEPDNSMTFEDAVVQTREALAAALRLRLRADVPIAFCMSGGIDSNGLIGVAHRIAGQDVHAFTIVNSHERYAEQDMVELAVAEQGFRHTPIRLETAGFLDNLKQVIAYHDAPVYTVSAYTHWLLMQAIAAHGYKIVIAGTGADELFSGYYDHQLYYLAELGMAGDSEYGSALESWRAHVLPAVQNSLLRDPERFVRAPRNLDHLSPHADRFRKCLRKQWTGQFTDRNYSPLLLRNRMLNELFVETIPPPLHEEDLNAMFFSLENRSPYLDRGLFELSYTIPTRHLIRDGRAKAVLREALRGAVPDALLDNRRKMGFNAPLFDLLDLSDRDVRSYLLDDSPFYDLVSRQAIELLLKQGDPDHHTNLFLFYVLSARIFMENAAGPLS
jgi:asparagine synthase (glutamine-hydrolysing)